LANSIIDLLSDIRIIMGVWRSNWSWLFNLPCCLMYKPDLTYRDLGVTAVLGILIYWLMDEVIVIYLSLSFVLMGFLFFHIRKWNHKFWLTVNQITEQIGGWIILFLLYFLLVTPIGWLFQLKFQKKKRKSNWVESDSEFSKERLNKTW